MNIKISLLDMKITRNSFRMQTWKYYLNLEKKSKFHENILLEEVQMVKNTRLQTVHTIKWIFFAISNFDTIEKILLSCHQLFEIFISSCQEFELHSALSLDTPVEIRFFLAALTSPFCPIYPAGQPASKPPVL